MKVLFISANTEKINIIPIPLGLNCVAAATQNRGHDVRMLDLMTRSDFRSSIREMIEDFSPDVIGVSVRNIDDQMMRNTKFLLEEVRDVIAYCRSLTNIPVVLGGAGYSIFPDAVLSFLDADMGIQGEGEAVFPQLVDRLARGEKLAGLPGLYVKGRGVQGTRVFVQNLDDIYLPGVRHFAAHYDRSLWMPFQTRRGCPMHCSYCSTATIEGRVIRKRTPGMAAEELKKYADAGFQHFYFVDNTFNLPDAYARELCRQMIRLKIDIDWRCIFYPAKGDEDLIKLMADAGCREVSLGFESGCDRILKNMNKHFTREDIRKTSLMLARHGIRQMGFLLLGGPGETRASVLESIDLADSLPMNTLKVSQGIRIYPCTTLAKIAVDEGRIAADENLLKPTFYMVAEIDAWLQDTVETLMAQRSHWVR